MEASYDSLQKIKNEYGSTLSNEEFYWAVNNAYHTIESEVYDQIHRSMYISLDMVWQRLLKKMNDNAGRGNRKLKVLDVGSGTGLVGTMLNRIMPEKIDKLDCVEPNKSMIEKSKEKSKKWGFEVNYINGLLGDIEEERKYDLIIVNSVLHHIVEIEEFLENVQKKLEKSGYLITAHDPLGESYNNTVSTSRRKRMQYTKLLDPNKVVNFLASKILPKRKSKEVSLEDRVNQILIDEKVVNKKMTRAAIYAVTDFHVPGQVGNLGDGFSKQFLSQHLGKLELVDWFSYQYFGVDWIYLGWIEKIQEKLYFKQNDESGFIFASLWKKV